jgi:1-deoxy-D-xylulose-5-phosphate reductoisomerase
VKRIVLTASGGPFRRWSRERLKDVTVEQALAHPTWQMGPKITVDSATMMNKALEIIEARWLFGLDADQIDVVVHPQSVVHSMVELTDGSVIAQLGVTDMRLPIQYAFSYPERWAAPVPSLDLARAGRLDFAVPDTRAFPCLRLAYRAISAARSLPVVLNAANEVAVARFLEGRIGFQAISQVVEQTMDAHQSVEVSTITAVRKVDRWAREHASEVARGVELNV